MPGQRPTAEWPPCRPADRTSRGSPKAIPGAQRDTAAQSASAADVWPRHGLRLPFTQRAQVHRIGRQPGVDRARGPDACHRGLRLAGPRLSCWIYTGTLGGVASQVHRVEPAIGAHATWIGVPVSRGCTVPRLVVLSSRFAAPYSWWEPSAVVPHAQLCARRREGFPTAQTSSASQPPNLQSRCSASEELADADGGEVEGDERDSERAHRERI